LTEPDPALFAALRDGPPVGSRRSTPSADPYPGRLHHHDHLRCRRRPPGRCVCHRSAGPDHPSRRCRHAGSPKGSATRTYHRIRRSIADLPLHHGRKHCRTPRRRVKIATVFIAAILTVSLASRFARAFELRVTDVTFDKTAQIFIRDTARRTIRFIANDPTAVIASSTATNCARSAATTISPIPTK
jgi:hypothetical protein